MSLTPEQITRLLAEIEAELGKLQPQLAEATHTYFTLDREMELRAAKARLAATGKTQTEKRDQAAVAIAAADDDKDVQHSDAKAAFIGLKAVVKVLETRTSILQSLLKWQRETGG
jgi:hypothetical protein